jgi:hypothetical protein
MIELQMLPAKDGDGLLLRYGDGARTRRVLVDAGRASSYPLIKPALAASGEGPLDLLVVTHVDQDHVLGVLAMFRDPERVEFNDVWFNGYDQLLDSQLESFGPRDGELLTTALMAQGVPWNRAFGGRAVEVGRALDPFDQDAVLRILSPDRGQLERLAPVWESECAAHGLIPGIDPVVPPAGFESFGVVDIESLADTPFVPDSSRTNATSIGFLFEYDDVRIMFTGDGDDTRLATSLAEHPEARAGHRVRLDALKVPHHGSGANLSRQLLDLIDCRRYLISTNGARHGHPDDVAMARILKYGGEDKEIAFNYRSRASLWDVPEWKDRYSYSVVMPPPESDGFLTLRW